MGVGQQSTVGLATTMLAAGAMVGKVSADIDQANVAKAAEADKLQEEFLQNKSGIEAQDEILNDPKLNKLAGAKGPGRAGTMTDIQAAQRALQAAEEKKQAMTQMNERIGKRFQKLTHTPIIGGDK